MEYKRQPYLSAEQDSFLEEAMFEYYWMFQSWLWGRRGGGENERYRCKGPSEKHRGVGNSI